VTSTTPDDGNYQNDIATRWFDFSGAGNIKTVKDWKRSLSYDYLYNNLNWLSFESSGPNNPVRLPEVSTPILPAWTYFPDNAHAVSSITNSMGQYKQFLYDANGNMTQGWDFANPNAPASRRDITWNADNMPVSIKYTNGINNVASTTLFAYDGSGMRVKKTAASGASTVYVSGVLEIISGVKTKYVFANGMRIARVTGAGTASIRHYYHKDHLGSTLAITDKTGAVVWSSDYEPYGLAR
ncbi:MAG: RHS domain-containing protein, partial [Nitrospirae bacterium]|nr:RHS domain-containing protein [Nitrospirota bacterium]